MTCIIGKVDSNGDVWIGGDSAAASSINTYPILEPKVFIRNGFILGCTTSFRMIDILAEYFNPPKKKKSQKLVSFMRTSVAEHLQELFKTKNFAEKNNEVYTGGTFLIGHQGLLFTNQSDYSLIRDRRGIMACGSGGRDAKASLLTTTKLKRLKKLDIPVKDELKLALEAGCENPYVIGPFVIKSLKKNNG